MSDTYSVSYPLSGDCRDDFQHEACKQERTAWDFVLDQPAHCTCRCHDQ